MYNNLTGSAPGFQKGEYVIYETSGVCMIAEITTLDWNNDFPDRLYYVLHQLNVSGGIIYIPVDSAGNRIKKILTKEEVLNLIEQMPDICPLNIQNEKGVEAIYKNAMRSFDRIEWIKLMKCIYLRTQERNARGKKRTATDERYMQMASEVLYSEFSLVLGVPKNKIEEFIRQSIEKRREN